MFTKHSHYEAALDRIMFLHGLERDGRIDQDDAYELEQLRVAVQTYEDALDAEAKAEHEFMQRFEEHFTASMER